MIRNAAQWILPVLPAALMWALPGEFALWGAAFLLAGIAYPALRLDPRAVLAFAAGEVMLSAAFFLARVEGVAGFLAAAAVWTVISSGIALSIDAAFGAPRDKWRGEPVRK